VSLWACHGRNRSIIDRPFHANQTTTHENQTGGIKYFMRSNLAIFASAGGDWVISGDDSNDGFAKQIDLGLKFYF
jgi:hypothetical protein